MGSCASLAAPSPGPRRLPRPTMARSTRSERNAMSNPVPCPHFLEIRDVKPSSLEGCEECLRIGSPWVHLRVCLTCGHVGCCDDSPLRHATAHFGSTSHPVIKSFEPGE